MYHPGGQTFVSSGLRTSISWTITPGGVLVENKDDWMESSTYRWLKSTLWVMDVGRSRVIFVIWSL
jgi:hypothetical protein